MKFAVTRTLFRTRAHKKVKEQYLVIRLKEIKVIMLYGRLVIKTDNAEKQ